MGLLDTGSASGEAGATSSTTAGNPSAPSTAPTTSTTTEAADWRAGLPEDLRTNGMLASFKSVDSLAKSYIHAQGMISKKGVIVPGEKATDEERAAFFDAIGRPALDKYDVKPPQGYEAPPEILTALKETSHKLGMLPAQAEGMLKLYSEMQANAKKASDTKAADDLKVSHEGLQKEWGQGFQKQIEAAQNALKVVGGPELAAHLKKTGIGDDTMIVKFMAKVNTLLAEDKQRGEGGGNLGMTPAEIQGEIGKLTSHPAYSDASHGMHKSIVDQVSQLYQKKFS